jgi:hypothetical protein
MSELPGKAWLTPPSHHSDRITDTSHDVLKDLMGNRSDIDVVRCNVGASQVLLGEPLMYCTIRSFPPQIHVSSYIWLSNLIHKRTHMR